MERRFKTKSGRWQRIQAGRCDGTRVSTNRVWGKCVFSLVSGQTVQYRHCTGWFKMTLFCPEHRGKGFILLPSNATGLELLLWDHYSVRYFLGASA